MDKSYTINVNDERVEIRGTLTIREAFDFLNFFEREGYNTLEDWGENTTLYLSKRDWVDEVTDQVNQEVIDDLELAKSQLDFQINLNKALRDRTVELESLIKELMIVENDKKKSKNNLKVKEIIKEKH